MCFVATGPLLSTVERACEDVECELNNGYSKTK